MEKKRSSGVVVCSIFVILLGLSHFFLFSAFVMKRSLLAYPHILKYILWLPLSLFYIVSGVFLPSLKRWAWFGTVFINAIFIILYIRSTVPFISSLAKTLVAYNSSNLDLRLIWSLFVFNILLGCSMIVVIVYLLRPKVKNQFK